jgi:hypothetical protein
MRRNLNDPERYTKIVGNSAIAVHSFHGGVGRKGAGQSRAVSSPTLRSPETSQVSTPPSNMRRCSPSHKCICLRLLDLLVLSFLVILPQDKSSWSDNEIAMRKFSVLYPESEASNQFHSFDSHQQPWEDFSCPQHSLLCHGFF